MPCGMPGSGEVIEGCDAAGGAAGAAVHNSVILFCKSFTLAGIDVVDNLSKEKRSKIMRSIRPKDTRPELLVRKILTAMGYRYRLHRKDIPGRPDIAFIGRKKAIFVNGCFWHAHDKCPIAHIPDSKFWREKLAANKTRDQKALVSLKSIGWKALTLWECELQEERRIRNTLSKFLG